ncbi:MAG: hypothetical protein RLZZ266_1147, partial [Bacteroidota bacterium]
KAYEHLGKHKGQGFGDNPELFR